MFDERFSGGGREGLRKRVEDSVRNGIGRFPLMTPPSSLPPSGQSGMPFEQDPSPSASNYRDSH